MISIMTWNTALTDPNKRSNAHDVMTFVSDYLKKENTIAVLQEIPYKNPEDRWNLHEDYRNIMLEFSNKKYRVFKNESYNRGRICMITIIVTALKSISQAEIPTTNRECAVMIDGKYTLYGLHAMNGDDNRGYLKKLDNINADIILGDFNAGDYEQSSNKDTFRGILKNHVCICNMPTKEVKSKDQLVRKTCIDHIFVRRELVTKCSNLIVHEDVIISDHYPITFDMDVL